MQRPNDACLGWWVKCGHFDITYPKYEQYYRDLRTMAGIISAQNKDIQEAVWRYRGQIVNTNSDLARAVNIQHPPENYEQNYGADDIRVTVI